MGIKKITILSLMTFLASCEHYQLLLDTKLGENERCRIRCYDTEKLEIAPIGRCREDWIEFLGYVPDEHPISVSIHYCDGIAGFKLETIATDIIPGVKEYRAYCEDKTIYGIQESRRDNP